MVSLRFSFSVSLAAVFVVVVVCSPPLSQSHPMSVILLLYPTAPKTPFPTHLSLLDLHTLPRLHSSVEMSVDLLRLSSFAESVKKQMRVTLVLAHEAYHTHH